MLPSVPGMPHLESVPHCCSSATAYQQPLAAFRAVGGRRPPSCACLHYKCRPRMRHACASCINARVRALAAEQKLHAASKFLHERCAAAPLPPKGVPSVPFRKHALPVDVMCHIGYAAQAALPWHELKTPSSRTCHRRLLVGAIPSTTALEERQRCQRRRRRRDGWVPAVAARHRGAEAAAGHGQAAAAAVQQCLRGGGVRLAGDAVVHDLR